jgi:hypothetical protein
MILGIDIGVAGAIAILDWSGALHEIHDMPTQKRHLTNRLRWFQNHASYRKQRRNISNIYSDA